MNRKQRRANKQKTHDPVYTVRESDMRSHIDRLLKTDPNVQRAIQEEARRVSLIEAEKQDKEIFTLILMSLHRSEKYGRKRLLRFAKTLMEMKEQYREHYEECDMLAMKKHLLLETGIDVDHLKEEVEKYVKDTN